jgi:glycosyltransferase involved in cell wall biosynthesis
VAQRVENWYLPETMRVGFDAALIGTRTTGIGLYTSALSRALAVQPDVSLTLMGGRREGDVLRHTSSRSLWFAAELPIHLRRSALDVFHGVNNFQLPLVRTGVPYVITVHDLIPELLPKTVSMKFRWQFRLWIRRSLSLASAVICVSEATRRDLLRFHPIDAARVHVVSNGVDHAPDRIDESEVDHLLAPLSISKPFFLYAGALDARKNVATLIEAARLLAAKRTDVELVVAGQDWFGSGPIRAQLEKVAVEGLPIRPVGFLPERTLYAAMQRAVGFVFPSRYEGFGLPPLEAMRLGTPAIVSDAGALPEVCGDSAIFVSPDDARSIADAMERLLRDPADRERRSVRARKRAAEFTWEICARQTCQVYRAAMKP